MFLFYSVWFGLVLFLLCADVQFVPLTLNIFEYSCIAIRCMAVFASKTFHNSVCLLTQCPEYNTPTNGEEIGIPSLI